MKGGRARGMFWRAVAGSVAGVLAWSGGPVTPRTAVAGGAETIALAGKDALGKGTLSDATLDVDGVVRCGPTFASTDLGAPNAWALLEHAGATWVGTGNRAEIVRVAADGTVTRIATGSGLMVTALAGLPGGAIAAAVFPDARIVVVDAEGKTSTRAALQAEHVWALHADAGGNLYAATGGPATLQRIDAAGAVDVLAKVDDEHVRCLVPDGKGWLMGSAPKGLVLVLAENGKVPEVLLDAEPQEVVGIVRLDDGSLIVAANEDTAGSNARALESLLGQIESPAATAAGQEPVDRPSLQTGFLLHLEKDGVLATLWTEPKVALLDLVRDGPGAVAGTTPSGRLIRVVPGQAAEVLADLAEAEASVLAPDAEGRLALVATSNPAVLARRRGDAVRGTWTSAPLDAGARALWGRIDLLGRGFAELAVRDGPTAEPDDAWSAWRTVALIDGRTSDLATTARFVQVRATLDGVTARLEGMVLVRRGPNQPPVVESLTVKIPDAPENGGPPANATPERTIEWKVKDADDEELHATISVRRTGSVRWHEVLEREVLGKPKWTWDTTGWPDGLYAVRLVVDDGGANPPDRMRSATREVAVHRVDNTAPRVEATIVRRGTDLLLTGWAEDPAEGRVHLVRVSIDGGPWVLVSAKDGLYDGARETFEATLAGHDAGVHDAVVQALDAEGNIGATAANVAAN